MPLVNLYQSGVEISNRCSLYMKKSLFSESKIVAILNEVETVALAGRVARSAPRAANRC